MVVIRRRFQNLHDDAALDRYLSFLVQVSSRGFSAAKREQASDLLEVGELDELTSVARQNRDHYALFPLVNDHLARLAGKSRWLEKTPSHVFHIDTIARHVPNAQFVEVVRDPRDVLASKKTRRQTVWSDRHPAEQRPRKHLEKGYDPFWDSLSWKAAVSAGRSAQSRHRPQQHTIHYEKLVADPTTAIRALCAFLQLEFEPAMLEVSGWNTADWEARKDRRTTGITTYSVGRWHETLTGAEVAVCQLVAAGPMRQLDYALEPSTFSDRLMMLPVGGRSLLEFWLRLFRKWRLGGSSYLISVVANYWRRLGKLLRSES